MLTFKHARHGMLTMLLGLPAALGGCYTPGGGLLATTGGPQTVYSTEMMQKTVSVIDARTNDVIFTIDIPPGKQLTFDFDAGEGDDPVYTPDVLRWELLDQGTQIGRLRNAMTVPNAASRRVEISLHRGVQYAAETPPRPLRADEIADRPAWWTPKGGPIPNPEKKVKMYDN